MIACDWRELAAGSLAPLFDRERQRWIETLRWDPEDAWRVVEQARTSWGLPGFVAIEDDGTLRGLLFYLPDAGRMEIGGVIADRPSATAALVEAAVAAGASFAHLRLFGAEHAPQLAAVLHAHGFSLTRYRYLMLALANAEGFARRDALAPASSACDYEALAGLLQDSYSGTEASLFAPDDTPEQWVRYVRNLIEQTACGVFDPVASRFEIRAGALAAAAVVTRIAPHTAHLAQIAVRPDQRGAGIARRLVIQACESAAADGCTAMTLLVAERNVPAQRLYSGLGFVDAGGFVAADYPLRLSSVALASAGAMTRR